MIAAGQVERARRSDHSVMIVTPVFNDWDALSLLLDQLEIALSSQGMTASCIAVNDGSTIDSQERLNHKTSNQFHTLIGLEIIDLTRNLGHQRAIAIGLAYAFDNHDPEAVVVMDSDGEDSASDVPRLMARCRLEGMDKVIFAERARRFESWTFRVFYAFYKALFRVLTGRVYRVGNFSIVPRPCLASLVTVSEIWNHYAAAVFKSRLPLAFLTADRSPRLSGRSKMNFTQLVIHGLSAISVHGEDVGVRMVVFSTILILWSCLGIVTVVGIRFLTPFAIPGWASTVVGNLVLLMFQAVGLSAIFSFIVLSGRQLASFFPIRDYRLFVRQVRSIDFDGTATSLVGPMVRP